VNLQLIIKRFQEKILDHPHEYMWFYKIWKYSQDANILILDDGRTGHLRQSQALCNILTEALEKKGKAAAFQIVQVRFKSEFTRKMCSVFAFLGQWFSGLRSLTIIKIFLEEGSFKELASVSADYIVSCGSAAAGINYLSAASQPAKSVTILKPGILPFGRFDLVVLPVHDVPKKNNPKQRIAVTRVALNLIDSQYMADHSQQLLGRYSHLKNSYRTKIGVLIGGDTKNVEFTESAIKMVIHQLKEVAMQLNADILLTTSRRTPENIEQILWREFKKFERCTLLISAVNSDVPEAVGGILGLSDYILVSGESISMVSEAISSGKKTVVFNVATGTADTNRNKYEHFVDVLNEQGYLVVCPIKGIAKALYSVISDKIYLKPLNDREDVTKVIEQII
jgi:mitochondrial fission protein ELM1